MPVDQFRRIYLDALYPAFLAVALDVIAACRARGEIYFATYGLRTYAEQDALFAQGRTASGRIVTNARAGQSAHNFGLAIDFTHDTDSNVDNGLQPDWNPAQYQVLREEVEKRGLVSGATFPSADWPHAQLVGYLTAEQLAPLDAIHRATTGDAATKLRAVWRHIDAPLVA